MISEKELFGKDSVRLNILKELTSGEINISFSLNGGVYRDYISDIHRDGSRMQVFGKFNISEDPSGEILTVRPIMVSGSLRITFGYGKSPQGRKVMLYRSATKSVENEFEITESLKSVELIPQGNVNYIFRLTYEEESSTSSQQPEAVSDAHTPTRESAPSPAAESQRSNASSAPTLDDFDSAPSPAASSGPAAPSIRPRREARDAHSATQPSSRTAEIPVRDTELERIQQETADLQRKKRELDQRRKNAEENLASIREEYEKDYDSFGKELEEYKAAHEIDQSVIDYYHDYDIVPVEQLMAEIKRSLEQAEKQIAAVIRSRQNKTMQIEDEIKSNKRQ